MAARKDIYKDAKGFDKNPQNINKNGRPLRFVSTVIKELNDLGIEKVKPSQIVDLYETLLNCTIKQLTELANDENAGWEIRQTAKYMIKYPEKAWNEIKDRAHGKVKQSTDIILDITKFNIGFKDGDN